jgi:hypothetical protein
MDELMIEEDDVSSSFAPHAQRNPDIPLSHQSHRLVSNEEINLDNYHESNCDNGDIDLDDADTHSIEQSCMDIILKELQSVYHLDAKTCSLANKCAKVCMINNQLALSVQWFSNAITL